MPAGGDDGVEDLGVHVEGLDAGPGTVTEAQTLGGCGAGVRDVGDGGVDGEVGGVVDEVVDGLGVGGGGGAGGGGGGGEAGGDLGGGGGG